MLASSHDRMLAALPDDAVVLDVGGWADPLPRADWVIDLMPYATRGLYQRMGWKDPASAETERFTEETWVVRDLCDRAPYPFADDEFDFAVCSHVLEDVRDPVWVCAELARVAKAGYVEVPSRLEEQSWGVQGPYVGWPHHHWIVDVDGDHVQFTFKSHAIHSTPGDYFPDGFWATLGEEERVQTLWWEDGFTASERVLVGEDDHLSGFVAHELGRRTAFAAAGPGGQERLPRRLLRSAVKPASRRRRRGGS